MLTEKISIILDSSSSVAAINWFILALPWLGAASLLNAFYLHLDKRFAQERVNLLLLAQHLDRAENT
jgi:hypothetical protein